MRRGMRARVIAGVAAVLVGLVWIGQGLGLLRGSSFMVDDVRWAAIGIVAIVAGVGLVVSARRRAGPPSP